MFAAKVRLQPHLPSRKLVRVRVGSSRSWSDSPGSLQVKWLQDPPHLICIWALFFTSQHHGPWKLVGNKLNVHQMEYGMGQIRHEFFHSHVLLMELAQEIFGICALSKIISSRVFVSGDAFTILSRSLRGKERYFSFFVISSRMSTALHVSMLLTRGTIEKLVWTECDLGLVFNPRRLGQTI